MYTGFLSFRYLRWRLSALAALLAVTFGVATLFTVFSVMEGYRVKLRELVRGLESHLTLLGVPALSLTGADELQEEIRRVPQVAATAPFIDTVAMYRSFGRFSYFHLKGIDPLLEAQVGDLAKHLLRAEEIDRLLPPGQVVRPELAVLSARVQEVMAEGRPPLRPEEIEHLFSRERRVQVLHAADPQRSPEPEDAVPGAAVVGINLLLDGRLVLGEEIKVITLAPDTGAPLTESFVVVGAFKSGEFETDSRTALIRISRMRTFLGLFDPATGDSRVMGIRIAVHDYREVDRARQAILWALAGARVKARIPALAELAGKVVSGFSPERVEGLVERLGSRWKGEQSFPEAEMRAAMQEAVERLRSPEVQAALERRLEEAYPRLVSGFIAINRGFSESYLLMDLRETAISEWELQVLGPPRAARPSPEELPSLLARHVVVQKAAEDLRASVDQPSARPLTAEVRTWEETRQAILLEAVGQEKWIVGFLVLLINGFTGCLVLLMLMLLVIEKTRDIGVLLALGATTRGVVSIFLGGGLFIVVLGVLLGLGAGYWFVENINRIHDAIYAATGLRLFDPETYKMDHLPTTVSVSEVVLSIIPSILLGLLASMVPAVWASRRDPIKAIHYE